MDDIKSSQNKKKTSRFILFTQFNFINRTGERREIKRILDDFTVSLFCVYIFLVWNFVRLRLIFFLLLSFFSTCALFVYTLCIVGYWPVCIVYRNWDTLYVYWCVLLEIWIMKSACCTHDENWTSRAKLQHTSVQSTQLVNEYEMIICRHSYE